MGRKGVPAAEPEAIRLAAALMYCDDRSQEDIKKILDLSQSAVSRLLKATEKVFWCKRIEPMTENIQRVPADVRRKAEAIASGIRINPRELALALGAGKLASHLLSVRVFASLGTGIAEDDWETRSSFFAYNAASYIRSLVTRGKLWGVTWGGQLDRLAEALEAQGFGAPRKKDEFITIVPLCGEPFGIGPTRESSSAIAERISLVLNGPASSADGGKSQEELLEPLSLSMVPAFIPRRSKDDSNFRDAVWDLIHTSKAHWKIFGARDDDEATYVDGAPPLAERLDGILTSISLKNRPFGYRKIKMFANAGLKDNEITKTYVGDIGGVGLVRAGRESAAAEIDSRWTGLKRKQLKACAARAASNQNGKEASPGVVVLCAGAERYDSVKQAIAEGLVTHLVCDKGIGDILEDLL